MVTFDLGNNLNLIGHYKVDVVLENLRDFYYLGIGLQDINFEVYFGLIDQKIVCFDYLE